MAMLASGKFVPSLVADGAPGHHIMLRCNKILRIAIRRAQHAANLQLFLERVDMLTDPASDFCDLLCRQSSEDAFPFGGLQRQCGGFRAGHC